MLIEMGDKDLSFYKSHGWIGSQVIRSLYCLILIGNWLFVEPLFWYRLQVYCSSKRYESLIPHYSK